MEIRKATHPDFNKIMKIYEDAAVFMAENGNPTQWVGYPSKEMVKNDIDKGQSYVCTEDEKILAVFVYFEENDPWYAYIEGKWVNDEPYGVVHRIASARKKKGVGEFCIKWAFEKCKNLRIDTHKDNIPMQNLIKKLNFEYCGIVYMDDGSPRIAFQKTK